MPPTIKKRPAEKAAAKKVAKKAVAKPAATKKPGKPAAKSTLAEIMRALEQAGSAQTRKTYARHGAAEPMFGVSFGTLKTMMKRIGVDHDLALSLWDTGNFDARNLATKIADPARLTPKELDRWVRESSSPRMCGWLVAMLAAEGPHAVAKASEWIGAKDASTRAAGWRLLGQLALRDETMADADFEHRLAHIERAIHSAPNAERESMNMAVVSIGCRSAGLRKAAIAAANRIGKVEIDHGDTACKTPDAVEYIEKTWAQARAKRFASPAAQERNREVPRLRC